jgi:hypothetical protein
MMIKKRTPALNTSAINGELKNLLEMFEFFLTQRQLRKSINTLGEAIRDLRIIIQRLLTDHFLALPEEDETQFCSSLAALLAERSTRLPAVSDPDRKYFDYLIGEILTCFEWAQEIKAEFPNDPAIQKLLAIDIPLLRPFDYGLRSKIHVVSPKRRRKVRLFK